MNMASELILKQKQELVENLTDKLKNAVAGVVVDYKGITVEDDTKLRRELREAGVEYFVVKNTMLRRAAENVGLSELNGVIEGATAIALSNEDHTAAARILTKYAETSKTFAVKAGFLDGPTYTISRKKAERIIYADGREEEVKISTFDFLKKKTQCNRQVKACL